MGKGSAPKADPAIGMAAMKSAETGAAHLAWMQKQADITNGWAEEARERDKTVFQPLQDDYIAKAKGWDTPERQALEAAKAGADVRNQIGLAGDQRARSMAAAGVDPASGRFAGVERSAGISEALAVAGAENAARDNVRKTGVDMLGNAINLGSGLGVNPLSAISTSNQAAASGANAAMQGYGQQAGILNQQHQNNMQAWQANQNNTAGVFGSIGGLIGTAFGGGSKPWIFSDEKMKENKRKPRSLLKAVENMRVEEWDYKPGVGDGGRHIGTYAQDFKRETGRGDGRTINLGDAIGATMGAVKELSRKVDQIAERKPRSILARKP